MSKKPNPANRPNPATVRGYQLHAAFLSTTTPAPTQEEARAAVKALEAFVEGRTKSSAKASASARLLERYIAARGA